MGVIEMRMDLRTGKNYDVPAQGSEIPQCNTGNAFFHPVTGQLVESRQFYGGNAHQEHENKTCEKPEKVKRFKQTKGS